MALSTKTGSFLLGTASGDVTITGVGFQPVLVFLWSSYASTVDTDTGASGFNIGWFHASAGSASGVWTHTQGGGNDRVATDAVPYMKRDIANSTRLISFVSVNGDGFVLNRPTAPADNVRINYLALAGTDITNVAVGTVQMPASATTFDVTGLGFDPTSLITLTDSSTGGVFGANPATSFSFGATDGTTQQSLTCGSIYERVSTDKLWSSGTNTVVSEGIFNSWLTGGFRLQTTTGTTQYSIRYLAIRGPSVKVGMTAMKTDTSNQVVTGLGFQPAALMAFCRKGTTANQTVGTTNPAVSFGGFDGTTQVSSSMMYDAAPNTASRVTASAFLQSLNRTGANTFVVDEEIDAVALDASGFTLTQSAAAAAANLIGYIAFGPAGGGSSSIAAPAVGSKLFSGLSRGLIR